MPPHVLHAALYNLAQNCTFLKSIILIKSTPVRCELLRFLRVPAHSVQCKIDDPDPLDRRKSHFVYFNLFVPYTRLKAFQRMLPTRRRSNPQPPDHQWDAQPTEPPRPAHPTGDQENAGLIPTVYDNNLSWRLIMKYFLRAFSPFR